MLPLTSLRSFKEKILRLFVVVQTICGRHGNSVIRMRTKFHLHTCYRRSEEVLEKMPIYYFVVVYKYGNM